uniref:Uncharacterized protein n=1 Tax=Anguilla anguilla TaxID=7936 RepID=A0A0E9SWE6_ANGAN
MSLPQINLQEGEVILPEPYFITQIFWLIWRAQTEIKRVMQ